MDSTQYRRFSGVVGVATVGLAVVFVAVIGVDVFETPETALLVSALVLAGILDLVAALDTPVTERIAWYRISGIAHIILGTVFSLWFASALGSGLLAIIAFLVLLLSTAGVGLDMLLFEGRHVYKEPLER